MAGALGFEPRIAVPKTAALPLGYAPNFLFPYIINENVYIVFDTTDQYLGNFFSIEALASLADLKLENAPKQAEPDPVTLAK